MLDKYAPWFGRLIIKCKKGNTFSRYVFNLSKYIDQAVVKEMLSCVYSGEKFEGYDRVHLPFHRLEDIFAGRILPTYYEALKKITGVYCLTDTHNGKHYIGSATGEGGVAQRWGNYLDSKHGGNKKLIALYEQKGSEYFEKYFTYTLLEYFGLSYDPIKILEREQYWSVSNTGRSAWILSGTDIMIIKNGGFVMDNKEIILSKIAEILNRRGFFLKSNSEFKSRLKCVGLGEYFEKYGSSLGCVV